MGDQRKRWHFFVDANLPPRLCELFRAKGYDATHVKDLNMEKATDVAIWKRAVDAEVVIVTKNKDSTSLG